MRKFLVTTLVLLGAACLLIGGIFLFREDLVRYAAGRFLADGQLTLTRLQGLQVSSSQLTVNELEFLLNASGQRLVIADLDVNFRVNSVSNAPQVDAITIGSAQLLAAAPESPVAAEEGDDAGGSGTLLSEMLTLLREFPLASIAVDQLTIPQRSVPITFTLQRGNGQLDAQVASGALRLQTLFTQSAATSDAQLAVTLTRADATVGNFELVLTPMGEVYALAGNGRLDVPDVNELLGELEQAPTGLPLQSARLDWTLAGNVADNPSGSAITGSNPQTFVLGVAGGSSVTLKEELASGLGAVTIDVSDDAAVTINSGTRLTFGSSNLPVRITSRWNEQAATVDARLTLTECHFTANAACGIGFDGNAAFGEYSLAGAIAANVQGGGRYHVATQGLALGGLPRWLPAFDVNANVTVDDDAITFSTPLVLSDASSDAGITVAGSYDRASSASSVSARLPELRFNEQDGALSTWFSAWPYTFDLLTGSLAAEAELRWVSGLLTGAVSADLVNVGGFHGDYFFGGVNGDLQADIDTSANFPVATPPLTLTAAALDIGVPMEDLRLDFSLDHAGLLRIDSFATALLDGTITGMDITYDFTRERNDVLVSFDGLRIERMLELVEYKGIVATGAVSGEIPLTITPTGVEVTEGALTADAPGGSIRYLAAATEATGNPGLDLMNQALSNYQFESLVSGIEYEPDGELVLEMKLQGHNPEMQGGQRINLNLNLSDNIPALLESLQAARKIEDFLEQQYQ